ncbi:hypothetical protein [Leptolyngbya sp. NIES-2104]|uniref:hypothetical protein n=1 Tax=Leptolyngbya sp. NIES-2104 TaxID=1552121 RepID=UPI00178C9149|nr:hypothetical protein [Leptolyngbya sp. NIES-2104]
MAIDVGKEYQANLSVITLGEARRSLSDILGVDRWVDLSTLGREELSNFFEQGREIERQYQL